MGDVINLNRFRKKKAKEEKERRAETNRRLHGRTKGERASEEAQKKALEDKLDGAFVVREDITLDEVPGQDAASQLEQLDAAVEGALTLSDLAAESKSDSED